ncbi:MAG: hypothetical protein EXQ79_07070, partial [Acidimicrobiia bacterium]|nr:hypothetical protein [Acidimicrobiia bacterium]
MRAGAWRTVAQHRATKDLMREIRSRHPGLRAAIGSDLRLSAANRDERAEYHSRWDELAGAIRLAWISDAFFAQTLYRLKAWLQQRGVPVLPRLAHRLAMSIAQVCIGDPVVMHPGVYIAHGQVVIDGFVEVHSGVVISPFVTI